MKTNLLAVLESKKIDVDNDILREVLAYVNVDSNIDKDDILSELEMNNLDYSGAVHEQIDSSVDVYNSQLTEWVGKHGNASYVEQAISDGLCDGTDFYKSLMAGQFLQIEEEFHDALRDLVSDVEDIEESDEE